VLEVARQHVEFFGFFFVSSSDFFEFSCVPKHLACTLGIVPLVIERLPLFLQLVVFLADDVNFENDFVGDGR